MVDPLNPIPLYHQLADEIAADIKSGKIADRQRLPSESHLEQKHGLARGTVRRAIRLLRERGLAFTIQGRGTFVGQPPTG